MVSVNTHRTFCRVNAGNNEKPIPQKPTLDQMKKLYSTWSSFSIPYFPAAAMTSAVNKRTKALEKYIKDNNLNIDVKNLELFFDDVKKTTGNMDTASAQNAISQKLQNYIENGYEPQRSLNRVVIKPKQDDALLKYNTTSEEEISKIKSILDDNISNAYRTFGM